MQERSRGSARGRSGFSSGFALVTTMVLASLGVGLMGQIVPAQERTPEQVLAELQKQTAELQRQFDDKLAELRKQGEPLTLTELAPPAVPDDQNAAVLHEQAFKLLEDIPRATDDRLRELFPRSAPAPTAEDLAEARKLLAPCAPALDLIRQGTLRPKCRFDLDYNANPVAMLLPHPSKVQRAGRLLSYESRIEIAQGRPDAAVADCVTALRLADGLKDEPIVVDQMVRFALIGMGTNGLQRVLDQSEPGEAALREAVGVLAALDDRGPLLRALKGERVVDLAVVRLVLDDPATAVELFMHTDGTSPFEGVKTKLMRASARPVLLASAIEYLDRVEQSQNLAAKPYYQSHQAFRQLENQVKQEYRTQPLAHLFAWMELPTVSKSALAYDRSLAGIGKARLAIALRLYRTKHGQYPDDLAVLVPDLIDKLPIDPFSGKDFIYRRDGNGFVLESVGDDDQTYTEWKTWKCSR